MSIYTDILNNINLEKIQAKFKEINNELIPCLLITSYLGDYQNGLGYSLNFDLVNIFGIQKTMRINIEKAQIVEDKDYVFIDTITSKLNDNKESIYKARFELDTSNYDINDPDSFTTYENFLKQILRYFNQNHSINECPTLYLANFNKYSFNDTILVSNLEDCDIIKTSINFCNNFIKDVENDFNNFLDKVNYMLKYYKVADVILENEKNIKIEYNKFIINDINDTTVDSYIKHMLLAFKQSKLLTNLYIIRDFEKGIKDYKFVVFDFEVFKKDWLVVFREVEYVSATYDTTTGKMLSSARFDYTGVEKVVVNNVLDLITITRHYDVVVGFNNKFYDNTILNYLIYYKLTQDIDLGDIEYNFEYATYVKEDVISPDFEIEYSELRKIELEKYSDIDKIEDINKLFKETSAIYKISYTQVFSDKNLHSYKRPYFKYKSLDCIAELQLGVGLKKIEAFLGMNIEESKVDFSIPTKLTKEQLDDVISYCRHDVYATSQILNERNDYFTSLFELCETFDLSDIYVTNTRSQLTGEILGCKELKRYDRLNLVFVDYLQKHIDTKDLDDEFFKNRYYKYGVSKDRVKLFNDTVKHYNRIKKRYNSQKKQLDFSKIKYYNKYKKQENETLKELEKIYTKLEKIDYLVEFAGVPHYFKFGGIHGAIKNYVGQGYFIHLDVTSFYPYLMIVYDFITRNTLYSERFRKIVEKRVAIKKLLPQLQGILKIVINATYGVLKSQVSAVFDPLNANNICVNGQLALADLVLRLSNYTELIQSNTDGIIIKLSPNDLDIIREIYKEWEVDFKLNLEETILTGIYQRDVNNYLALFEAKIDKNGKKQYKNKAKGRFGNTKKYKFDKNDKTFIDKTINARFISYVEKLEQGFSEKKAREFDVLAYLKELAYEDLGAFQFLCVKGATFVGITHTRKLYDDMSQKEKEELLSLIEEVKEQENLVSIKDMEENGVKYKEIEYKLNKINRGFATTNKSYGIVRKIKAGVRLENEKVIPDYKLDDNGKLVLDKVGNIEYNTYSYSKVSDTSNNVLIYNNDIKSLTKEEIDNLELDFNYYADIVLKNDFLSQDNSQIITNNDLHLISNNWKILNNENAGFENEEIEKLNKKFKTTFKEIKKELSIHTDTVKSINEKTILDNNFINNLNELKTNIVNYSNFLKYTNNKFIDRLRTIFNKNFKNANIVCNVQELEDWQVKANNYDSYVMNILKQVYEFNFAGEFVNLEKEILIDIDNLVDVCSELEIINNKVYNYDTKKCTKTQYDKLKDKEILEEKDYVVKLVYELKELKAKVKKYIKKIKDNAYSDIFLLEKYQEEYASQILGLSEDNIVVANDIIKRTFLFDVCNNYSDVIKDIVYIIYTKILHI